MALRVPGKLRRIDTNEAAAAAESQLSAEHTQAQGSAIQGYYHRQACLAAATLALQTDTPLAQADNLFLQLLES